MRGLDKRDPGIAAGLLLDERVTVGLISDGHHLADATLALAWRLAGAGRVSLVSDGIAALGQPPGEVRLGDQVVDVDADGSARLADGRLAGASLPLDAALRRLMAATGSSAADAVASVTEVPARLLGLADRGHLRPGARADFVLLTADLQVVATFVGGEAVHGREALAWH
jgi:N-acetylglucosamine-6-phosphate deacetylase